MGLLSVAIWLPIVLGSLLLVVGRDEHAGVVRWLALAAAVLSFLVTIPLVTGFDVAATGMQFVENLPWIDRFNVRYHLGVLLLWLGDVKKSREELQLAVRDGVKGSNVVESAQAVLAQLAKIK